MQWAPLFFQEENTQAFIWTLTRHDNKLGFITETEPRQLWKIQPRESFVLPAGIGYRMNLVITHAVKPRKLITDIHGPQLTGLHRFTEEDGSCGRSTEPPCWACSICVINIYALYAHYAHYFELLSSFTVCISLKHTKICFSFICIFVKKWTLPINVW